MVTKQVQTAPYSEVSVFSKSFVFEVGGILNITAEQFILHLCGFRFVSICCICLFVVGGKGKQLQKLTPF